MKTLALTPTHSDLTTGYRRWEFTLPTGLYALTLTRGKNVSVFPVTVGTGARALLANPRRATALMKGYQPAAATFEEEFEAHLSAHGLDPLSSSLAISAVRDAAREVLEDSR